MNKIRAIAHPEVIRRRAAVLPSLDPFAIQGMDRDELLALQDRLGYGRTWGVWEVPKAWLAPSMQSDSKRTACFVCEAPHSDRAWTELLRFALLCCIGRGSRSNLAPSSVVNYLRIAIRLVPAIAAAPTSGEGWWSRLSEEEMINATSPHAASIAAVLRSLFRRGYLPEQPAPSARDDGPNERNRKGEQARRQAVDDSREFLPLPDVFTGQCGQRALWVVQELGPTMLDCLEAALDAPIPAIRRSCSTKTPGERTQRTESQVTNTVRSAIVRAWHWSKPNGESIDGIPFAFVVKRILRTGKLAKERGLKSHEDFNWPARGWADLLLLIPLLQACHAWVLLLASGPRASTVLSYTENCLVPMPGGYRLQATLFKTTDDVGGRRRDWPVPPVVLNTVRQQIRLARLVKRLARPSDPGSLGDHLWVQTKDTKLGRGGPLRDLNQTLDRLVDRFALRHLLGDDAPRLHIHRFRKTLARILALTLTNAQMVLMDCFGHEDPAMTLSYMTSDKALMADAQRAQRELVVLMAKEAIEQVDTLGGSMGVQVRQAKAEYLRVHRKSHLDPRDIYELAEVLTLGGRNWVLVMPGVICTLPIGYTGPCASRQGGRNPGNCQSGCGHQLLLAYHKSECDDMVRYILEHLQRAVDEDSVNVPLWQGQLRNWLYRWGEVYDQWADHPLVKTYGDTSINREAMAA